MTMDSEDVRDARAVLTAMSDQLDATARAQFRQRTWGELVGVAIKVGICHPHHYTKNDLVEAIIAAITREAEGGSA